MRHRRWLVPLSLAALVSPWNAISGTAAAAGSSEGLSAPVETVARGLDNPRGIAVLPGGRLVLAQAGHAGDVCLGPGECLGLTGRVTRIDVRRGTQRTLAHGLPSFSGPFGAFGLGGVALRHHTLAFVVGLNPQAFGNPTDTCHGQPAYDRCVATVGAAQRAVGVLGQVTSLRRDRGWRTVAGVGAHDFDYAAAHPDPGNPEYAPGDANPFGLATAPKDRYYVVDAASNTLDRAGRRGDVSVLAFVPDPPNHQPIYDAAPTCAARTPNGDVYVGTESSSLWRWDGRHLTKVLTGGKVGQVVGCVADTHGNLYLVNLASRIRGSFPNFHEQPFDGSIVKVTPDLRTHYVLSGLNLPTGIALDRDGRALYVAVNGLCPADLSLLTPANAPVGACPEPGKVIKVPLGR